MVSTQISLRLDSRRDLLNDYLREVNWGLSSADAYNRSMTQLLARTRVTPSVTATKPDIEFALYDVVSLTNGMLITYQNDLKQWRALVEEACVAVAKSMPAAQTFFIHEWIINDPSITLLEEDRNFAADTLRSVCERTQARTPADESVCTSIEILLLIAKQARDTSPAKFVKRLHDTLVNADSCPRIDEVVAWPLFSNNSHFTSKLAEIAVASLTTEHSVLTIPNLSRKLPWIPLPSEPPKDSSSAVKVASSRERKQCPACERTSQVMQPCPGCSTWMHEDCLRKHNCPNAPAKRPTKTHSTDECAATQIPQQVAPASKAAPPQQKEQPLRTPPPQAPEPTKQQCTNVNKAALPQPKEQPQRTPPPQALELPKQPEPPRQTAPPRLIQRLITLRSPRTSLLRNQHPSTALLARIRNHLTGPRTRTPRHLWMTPTCRPSPSSRRRPMRMHGLTSSTQRYSTLKPPPLRRSRQSSGSY
jgi:hypothetical protein